MFAWKGFWKDVRKNFMKSFERKLEFWTDDKEFFSIIPFLIPYIGFPFEYHSWPWYLLIPDSLTVLMLLLLAELL